MPESRDAHCYFVQLSRSVADMQELSRRAQPSFARKTCLDSLGPRRLSWADFALYNVRDERVVARGRRAQKVRSLPSEDFVNDASNHLVGRVRLLECWPQQRSAHNGPPRVRPLVRPRVQYLARRRTRNEPSHTMGRTRRDCKVAEAEICKADLRFTVSPMRQWESDMPARVGARYVRRGEQYMSIDAGYQQLGFQHRGEFLLRCC